MPVRFATGEDVPGMVALSARKRAAYAKHQPVFWRRAEEADSKQERFFHYQLEQDRIVPLVHETDGTVDGFMLAAVVPAPPVYDPGGLTCMVDDFAVAGDELWPAAGRALLDEIRRLAAQRGAVQVVVVCGLHDQAKRRLLAEEGLGAASEWYVGPTNPRTD